MTAAERPGPVGPADREGAHGDVAEASPASAHGHAGDLGGLAALGELAEAVAHAAPVVRVVPGGPMLVKGPVDVEAPDGVRVCSDRFMVAVCLCRRSRNYPMCDTSHRRKVRSAAATDRGR